MEVTISGVTDFQQLLEELKGRAGSWRAIEKMMLERNGEKVSAMHLANMHDGRAVPSYEVVRKLAGAYPDLAARLYVTAGYPPPLPEAAAQTVEGVREIAARRGIPETEVIPTLVREALEDYG